MVPGQNYSWGIAVPPNAFPAMLLLSQWRCADTYCHGGDRRFRLINLIVLNERLALLSL
jgi:hypothetical protein